MSKLLDRSTGVTI